MRIVMCAAAFVLVGLTVEPAAAQAPNQAPAELRNSMVTIDYIDPRSDNLIPVMEGLKKRKALETLAQFMAPIRLPRILRLRTKECGEENAFYVPEDWALTVCYENVAASERDAPKETTPEGFTRNDSIIGGFIDTSLHEFGHALFDILQVPVLGREEDAADQMSGFLMLQFNADTARTAIKGGAYFYRVLGTQQRPVFSDVHGTPAQRFLNYLCLAYGGQPETFKDFVDKGYLPKPRAENCAAEYQQAKLAFTKTILPHVDQDLAQKVQSIQWLRPDEMK